VVVEQVEDLDRAAVGELPGGGIAWKGRTNKIGIPGKKLIYRWVGQPLPVLSSTSRPNKIGCRADLGLTVA
jgi:hypothetical protein